MGGGVVARAGRCQTRHEQRWSLTAVLLTAALVLACTGGKQRVVAPGSNAANTSATVAAGATAAAGVQAPLAADTLPAPTPSRAETVKIVYDDLLDRYYKPLKSSDVLNNAWKGATQAAHGGSGVSAPRLSGD